MHPPALDLAFLAEQTFGDRALARDVLALFEEQCEALLPVVADAAGPTQQSIAAHSLKGAARAVGAIRLAACLERFEEILARGAPQEEGLAQVLAAAAEARAASARHLGAPA